MDYVLTFQEVQDIFEAAGIDPSTLEESEKITHPVPEEFMLIREASARQYKKLWSS